MLPNDLGATVFLEWDYQNQNQNWHGTSSAPPENNSDKEIRTNFWTLGSVFLFSRSWGMIVRVPYEYRDFITTADSGGVEALTASSLGDIRLQGIYTGFSDDLSTGLTFGFKLPTGSWQTPGFDRDTQVGSGSTDLLLGIYHIGPIISNLNWFTRTTLDWPFATQGGYNPGSELDTSLGAYYSFHIGSSVKIAPLFQVLGSYRTRDSGPQADYIDTGFVRVLVAPGVEVGIGNFSVYADAEFPVYQNMNGNQLVASVLVKSVVAYHF